MVVLQLQLAEGYKSFTHCVLATGNLLLSTTALDTNSNSSRRTVADLSIKLPNVCVYVTCCEVGGASVNGGSMHCTGRPCLYRQWDPFTIWSIVNPWRKFQTLCASYRYCCQSTMHAWSFLAGDETLQPKKNYTVAHHDQPKGSVSVTTYRREWRGPVPQVGRTWRQGRVHSPWPCLARVCGAAASPGPNRGGPT